MMGKEHEKSQNLVTIQFFLPWPPPTFLLLLPVLEAKKITFN